MTMLPTGDTITREDVDIITDPFEGDPGDPDKHAHLVAVEPGQSAVKLVDHAIMTGTEVVAMCGYRWVPKQNHAYEKPMCKACSKALAGLD